ncbi:MAG TPA: hypothetical protein VIS29_08525 [Streptomyces sp.]
MPRRAPAPPPTDLTAIAAGDGMESDALGLTWGQSVRLGISATTLNLVI